MDTFVDEDDDQSYQGSEDDEFEGEWMEERFPLGERFLGSCRLIANNDPLATKVTVLPYHPAPRPGEWIWLGDSIGRNNYLKKFILSMDGNEDEDEITTKSYLEEFCRGVAGNRSVEFLMFQEYDFSRARLAILHPIVIENRNLVDLRFHNCSLSPSDIQGLSNAFRLRNNPSSIKCVDISGRDINDDHAEGIVDLCMNCPEMERLDMSYSAIGNASCRHLASLLRAQRPKLKRLALRSTSITSEGLLVLASALGNNKSLKQLFLDDCPACASLNGLNCLSPLICDTSTINATYRSNHCLERISKYDERPKSSDDFWHSLRANSGRNKVDAARKKIIRHHFSDDFSMDPFVTMQVELLPMILGWIGKDHCNNNADGANQSRLPQTYRILRSFPGLCSFASSEGLQLDSENAQLKADISDRKEQNAGLSNELETQPRKRQKGG